MKIAIAGASGLIGSALVPHLRTGGHEVFRLVRRPPEAADEIGWDPAAGRIEDVRMETVDAIVNLAGENVGAGRWTEPRRDAILRSRIDSTRTLVGALAKRARPEPAVLLNASAVGIYGGRGEEILTEEAPSGRGFLPDVCRAWEAEAQAATRLGVRTVLLRLGVVIAAEDGAMAKMLPIFRLGLGGPLGGGAQWMSWVAIEDAVRAIGHALRDTRCAGPVNVVSPRAVTNAEFARVLGRVLRRPAVLPVPAWALRAMFGQMADETVLMSTHAVPARLSALEFQFRHSTLEDALRTVLK